MRPRVRVGVAALLSCSIYALPLVGPHAAFLLGETLAHSVTRGEESAAWIAAELGVALVMQLGAAGIWYWVLGNPVSPRLGVVLIAIPAFFAFAEWCYLGALPTYFLIEKDVRREQRAWEIACSIPNQSLVVV